MRLILKNFNIVDEETNTTGNVIIDEGIITAVQTEEFPASTQKNKIAEYDGAVTIIDGSRMLPSKKLPLLMPAFIDLHAHFRDPGFPEKENLESASLAAAAGGFGTVVCMANTRPVTDTLEKATALKKRSDCLGLIDLYPVLSLSKNMDGKELSGISAIPPAGGCRTAGGFNVPLLLSEDGKDLADDALFLAAMKEAKRIGIPVSCHCDFGGDEALSAKNSGQPRSVWSRIEENNATRRAIELGRKAGCHIHIAHVSTKEAVEMIRRVKAAALAAQRTDAGAFTLTCEATPHHICLTEEDAVRLGDESHGRVNPSLRPEEDRKALIQAVADGTIDAIATDHAPHSRSDKEEGAPGFSGFETAFAAVFTELVHNGVIGLKRISSLMTAFPARLLGLYNGSQKRGRILPGYRADLVMLNTEESWIVNPLIFKSRGSNSPFGGRQLRGKILMTIHAGRVVNEQ